MKIYQLTTLHLDTDEKIYPVELSEKESYLFFSSITLAIAEMMKTIVEQDADDYPALYFKIETKGVDEEVEWECYWYDAQGNFLTKDLHGETPAEAEPKFQAGEIVQFLKNSEFRLGVVFAAPQIGDEGVYLIDELEAEHDHICEALISLPQYPLTPAQDLAYQALKTDVLDRLARKDRSGPKNIPLP